VKGCVRQRGMKECIVREAFVGEERTRRKIVGKCKGALSGRGSRL
jgi:hypothetical protein